MDAVYLTVEDLSEDKLVHVMMIIDDRRDRTAAIPETAIEYGKGLLRRRFDQGYHIERSMQKHTAAEDLSFEEQYLGDLIMLADQKPQEMMKAK